MIRILRTLIQQGLEKQVPATGLGIFRLLFGLVALQEIIFLLYFRHLIFDPIPFVEMASPVIHLFLVFWIVVAFGLAIGYRTRLAAVANYLLWLVFVGFTPMWQDFDGGFDQFMVGSSFLLMFLPSERAFSVDSLRLKLQYSTPGHRYRPPHRVPVLSYYLPVAISLGLLYFDAAIHKLSAEFWRNGMGAWLPPTMPYYMSALDMSWLLNNRFAEMSIGYTLIVFQFLFLPLFWFRRFRVALLLIGASFHLGIILSLNIYPFGFGMLVYYALLVPFAWWRRLGSLLQRRQPAVTVFYDQQCPLCNRTVIILGHFDVCKAIEFKGLQSHARNYRQLDGIPEDRLLQDIYALDRHGRLFAGLDTYIHILSAMIYPAPLALLLRVPGIYHVAKGVYRRIADNRARVTCDETCAAPAPRPEHGPFALLYAHYAGPPRQQAIRIAKFVVLILLLQLNSTIHFGLVYRLNEGHATSAGGQALEAASDAVLLLSHTFLGITPHALYMHDHFQGYNHILALTYQDQDGRERWLPFVNPEGRIVAPNWGRIQSMWANVAVTRHINRRRLDKGIMRVTAFWGAETGLDLNHTEFTLKMKEVRVPMDWEKDLREFNIRQPWQDIGKIMWKDGTIHVDILNVDFKSP